MSDHPIQGLMTTAMESLKDMIDVNTIIGDPVQTPDGGIILTVSKVGFGFAAGGSEFVMGGGNGSTDSQEEMVPFGGGSGGGVSITPVAFLIVNKEEVRILHLNENTHLIDKLIDMAPDVVDKIKEMMNKRGSNCDNDSEEKFKKKADGKFEESSPRDNKMDKREGKPEDSSSSND